MKLSYLEKYVANEDAIVFGLPSHLNQMDNFDEIDTLLGGELDDIVKSKVLTGRKGEISTTAVTVQRKVKKVIAIGLGNVKELTQHDTHTLIGKFFQYLQSSHTTHVQILMDTFNIDTKFLYESIGLMSKVSIYEFDSYKTDKKAPFYNKLHVTLTSSNIDIALQSHIERYQKLGESINFARALSDTPPNILYPSTFVERVTQHLEDDEYVNIDIKDEHDLLDEGFGLITAVGKASLHQPRLLTIEYCHPSAKDAKPVALVGKGITYDSGGYTLKTKSGMVEMKYDMSGGANVVGMISAMIKMQLPIHVVAVVALAENMIDNNGMKPDDVYISYSGQSVEVTNTDAEGRLVLADALFYASQYSPKLIMDFATLTGAVIAAIGPERTGVFTNKDYQFIRGIMDIGNENGEYIWHLPVTELEDKAVKDSSVADLTNSNGKPPGASFAAGFLKQFVNGTPWMHFDIAGTSHTKTNNAFGPKGASGVMIRTVVKYFEGLTAHE